ncbi:MAG: translocation/assembly module TamB domain-containing protein [Deltaproteobacteria bacterium]|jgi:hypothetical protein|nr:translocation/assembly module TamB domain-containing protein [Deltaproteobacteria bacterium]
MQTSVSLPTTPQKKSLWAKLFSRKTLKLILKFLSGLLILLALLAAGVLIWLRTTQAEALIQRLITEQLASQGIFLRLDKFSGPLPGSLKVAGLELADSHGPWLRVKEAEIQADLLSLLKLELAFDLLRLDSPELVRLPEAEADSGEAENPTEQSDTPFSLPFSLRFAQLSLEGGKIGQAVLDASPDASIGQAIPPASLAVHPDSDAPALTLLPEMSLSLRGHGALSGRGLNLNLDASLLHTDGSGLELSLYTGPTGRAPKNLQNAAESADDKAKSAGGETIYWPLEISGQDTLKIRISAREDHGGLLAQIAGQPDLPAYELLFEGSGPPQDWAAELNLDLANNKKHLLNLRGRVGFNSKDSGINFDRLFSARLLTWLDLRLTPGEGFAANDLGAGSAGKISGLLTPTLDLRADGELEDGIFRLEAAGLETETWLLRASDLELNSKLLGGSRLRGKLAAEIKDGPAFMQVFGDQASQAAMPGAEAAFPVQRAEFTSDLQIDFSGSEGSGDLSMQMGGRLQAFPTQTDLRLDLSMHSNELTAGGSGNDAPSTSATIRLAGNNTVWGSPQLDALLGGKPLPNAPQGGSLNPSATQGGLLRLDATRGGLLRLDAGLNGNAKSGYTLKISALDVGLAHLSGQAKLQNAGPPTEWGNTLPSSAWLKADFLARLDSLEPLLADSGFREKSRPNQNRQKTGQSGTAAGTSPHTLAATNPLPVHGATLNLEAEGRISDLKLKSLLQVADLRAPSGVTLNGIRASFTAQRSASSAWHGLLGLYCTPTLGLASGLEQRQAPSFEQRKALGLEQRKVSGQDPSQAPSQEPRQALSQESGQGPGGELRLESGWEFSPSDSQGSLASLRGLQVKADGLLLNADIQALLPDPASPAAQPALTGEGRLEISDWKTLAALSGVRLGGDPASADFKLAPEADGQSLALSYKMGRFGITGSDDSGHGVKNSLFSLGSLGLELTAHNIFQLPRLDLKAETGAGRVGRLNWRSGTARIDSLKTQGDFSLALMGRSGGGDPAANQTAGTQQSQDQKSSPNQKTNQNQIASQPKGQAPNAASGDELLALAGRFNLAEQSAIFDQFILRANNNAAAIKLLAPASLDFSQGLNLPALKLGMTPGGSLDASAVLDAGGEQLKLAARDLDFKVFTLFTDAHLPTGALSLDADFSRKTSGTSAGAQTGSPLSGQLALQALLVPDLGRDRALAGQNEIAPDNPETDSNEPNLIETRPLAPGQALSVKLTAGISPVPLPRFPALRRQAGFNRLQGQGRISYADAPKNFKDAELDFDFPLRLDHEGLPSLDLDAPLGVSLNWRGPAEPFWRIMPMADRELSGFGEIALAFGGSLNKPVYSGNASLASGRYEDHVLGLLLNAINLEIKGHNNQLDIRLAANDGGKGNLALEGALLPPGSTATETNSAQPLLSLRGQINHLSPLHRDDLSIQLSGIFSANGPLSAPAVAANLELERGEYNLRNLGGGVRTLEISDPLSTAAEEEDPGAAGGSTLDVNLNIPNRFYVRGMGIESEWAGSLRAFGPAAQPELTGSISPVRGYFELLTRPFAFSGGGVHFLGGKKINPNLDLQLTYAGPSITAQVDIGGTANRPRLSLSSNPPRPQDQVLAEVLFGKDFSSLSRFEAIQVASSLQQLSGGGFDFMGSMRRTLGVDMLRVSGGESMAQQQRNTYGTLGAADLGAGSAGGESENNEDMPRLEAGKYINDAIYIGFEQGVTEGSTGVRVEVELRPNLTLQGRSNTQSSEVGIGWKKDY